MGTKAYGRILFWEGASLWLLRARPGEQYPSTDFHSHHVIQLTLALTERVEFDDGAERISGVSIAVAPDVSHAFAGTGTVAHLFVAPDTSAGRAIVRALFSNGKITHIPDELLSDFPSRLRASFEANEHNDDALRRLGRDLIAHLAGQSDHAPRADARIDRLIKWVTSRLDEAVSLGDAASFIGLSEGRTRHLFVEQTGLSFRTFLLWVRLVRAVEMFAAGASLTDAAHGAGFADSAHLSRTFRRMFGISADSLRVL